MAKATAGEKFFKALTNAEYGFLARTTGVRVDDWDSELDSIQANAAVLVVASKRVALRDGSKALTHSDVENMTPTETQEELMAALEALGFVDDEDDAEDFPDAG